MKYTMLVKCEKCGYENFPQHRFCGMCAAELRIPGPAGAQPAPAPSRILPPAVPAPKRNVSTTVSGPSFLGLANEPADTRSASYLLEDEPEPRHWGRYLALILLAGAIGAGWYWRADLGSVAAQVAGRFGGASGQPNSPAPAVSGATSEAAPPGGPSAQVEQPGTGAGDPAPPAAAQPAQPAAPEAASPVAGDANQSPQPDQLQTSNQSQPDDAAPAPVTASRPARPPAVTTDDLVAEGEKYLYGNGVPENCGRARNNLLAAAQRSNAKAQNVLGTMYATGHCATRDLPTAYRWFGRSLRKDPGNTRIEQDLKVLWNQMTPEERKLALKDAR
jgi:hypothetical protein